MVFVGLRNISIILVALLVCVYGKGINSFSEEILTLFLITVFFFLGLSTASEVVSGGVAEKIEQRSVLAKQYYATRFYLHAFVQRAIAKKYTIRFLLRRTKIYKKLKKIGIKIGVVCRRQIRVIIKTNIKRRLRRYLKIERIIKRSRFLIKLCMKYLSVSEYGKIYMYIIRVSKLRRRLA